MTIFVIYKTNIHEVWKYLIQLWILISIDKIPRSNVSHVSVRCTINHVDLFDIYFKSEKRHKIQRTLIVFERFPICFSLQLICFETETNMQNKCNLSFSNRQSQDSRVGRSIFIFMVYFEMVNPFYWVKAIWVQLPSIK